MNSLNCHNLKSHGWDKQVIVMEYIYEMIMSVRFCLSYDLLNVIYRLKRLFISMKICIVVTDMVMTLLILAESVM